MTSPRYSILCRDDHHPDIDSNVLHMCLIKGPDEEFEQGDAAGCAAELLHSFIHYIRHQGPTASGRGLSRMREQGLLVHASGLICIISSCYHEFGLEFVKCCPLTVGRNKLFEFSGEEDVFSLCLLNSVLLLSTKSLKSAWSSS